MIELDQHEGAYLDICKHYRAVYDTPIIKEDPEKWKKVGLGYVAIEMLSKPGSCGRRREWARLGVDPLSWLLSKHLL